MNKFNKETENNNMKIDKNKFRKERFSWAEADTKYLTITSRENDEGKE